MIEPPETPETTPTLSMSRTWAAFGRRRLRHVARARHRQKPPRACRRRRRPGRSRCRAGRRPASVLPHAAASAPAIVPVKGVATGRVQRLVIDAGAGAERQREACADAQAVLIRMNPTGTFRGGPASLVVDGLVPASDNLLDCHPSVQQRLHHRIERVLRLEADTRNRRHGMRLSLTLRCRRRSRRTARTPADSSHCRRGRDRPRCSAQTDARHAARSAAGSSHGHAACRACADIRPGRRTTPDRIAASPCRHAVRRGGSGCARPASRTGSRRWRAAADSASPARRATDSRADRAAPRTT